MRSSKLPDATGTIVVGHARYKAALKQGMFPRRFSTIWV